MRALLVIAAIFLVLVLAGWVTVNWTDNTASVTLEPQKIEHDTDDLVNKGRDLINGQPNQGAVAP